MSKYDFTLKVIPKGCQLVSDKAIAWLYENHRDAYNGFYERLLDGIEGIPQQAHIPDPRRD